MFVGGTFSSRVWNGQDFVTIVDVAQFVGDKQVSHTQRFTQRFTFMYMRYTGVCICRYVCICVYVYICMCVSMLGGGVSIKALETLVPVHCDA